jgi:transposase
VLWWRRTGAPWRDLPDEFGPWKTVFNRFDRWSKNGKWQRLFEALQTDIDGEWHSLDSTINRAHQHSAGGKGGPKRMPSVVHAADPRPKFTSWSTHFEVTAGQRHDSQSALPLIATVNPKVLLGDKAYDVDAIRDDLRARNAVAVIPPKANRKAPVAFDKDMYKGRSTVECTFNLLKQARRFATRYEKTVRNYTAVVVIGLALLWLRI